MNNNIIFFTGISLPFGGIRFWRFVIISLITVLSCAGGFFSGMTVGLNSLDKLTLEVQQITGK